MEYIYDDLSGVPCSGYIRDFVAASAMTNKEFVGTTWNPNGGTGVFCVFWNAELSAGDKTLLDGIVDDSLGKKPVVKDRNVIMQEILESVVDETQLNRLLNALDNHASMVVCLDNNNYLLARARVQKVYDDGAITLADRDLVLSKIPTSDYE